MLFFLYLEMRLYIAVAAPRLRTLNEKIQDIENFFIFFFQVAKIFIYKTNLAACVYKNLEKNITWSHFFRFDSSFFIEFYAFRVEIQKNKGGNIEKLENQRYLMLHGLRHSNCRNNWPSICLQVSPDQTLEEIVGRAF